MHFDKALQELQQGDPYVEEYVWATRYNELADRMAFLLLNPRTKDSYSRILIHDLDSLPGTVNWMINSYNVSWLPLGVMREKDMKLNWSVNTEEVLINKLTRIVREAVGLLI